VKPEGGLHALARLSDAVALAQKLVPEQGCILLSPGAPSFPHFRDFEERGNQFQKYAGIEKSIESAH
jgi:UDP-N-acetylmuramoylalanine--D-glutamate ligase